MSSSAAKAVMTHDAFTVLQEWNCATIVTLISR